MGKTQPKPDPETILRQIREQGEQIRQDELECALRKLENQGGITEAQRQTVRTLTHRIVSQLFETPESTLEHASSESIETLRTVTRLFSPVDERK